MRNLKRALSLVMAAAMLIGMMVISASAAGKDFTDKDEIRHTEAVNTMTALNVISGKEDGSYFDPTGTLTRAEMAKIVAYVMNGGVEPNIGTKLVPTYSDIDNHWAEAYIEYCTSMDIIAGDGAGKFNPEGTLTASQAAKMFLTAMGYNAEVFGLLGNDWETNTNRYANEAGLYDDLGNVGVSNPISRDDAAQMAYNAIQATLVERTWSQNQTTGQITEGYELSRTGKTLLSERFGAKIYIGTFIGNYNTGATGTEGEVVVDGKLSTAESDAKTNEASFPSDLDIANIGEQVKVIFKDGTSGKTGQPDKNDTIYGVFNTGATTVITGTKNDVDDLKSDKAQISIGGVKYDVNEKGVTVITNYMGDGDKITGVKGTSTAISKLTDTLNDTNGDLIKAVTNPDTGDIDTIYVTASKIAAVTAVNSEKVTLNNNVGTIEIADNDVYEGIAKGDVVVVTTLYDKVGEDKSFTTVEKAEVVSGTVDSYKDAKSVKVDGTSYSIYNETNMLSSIPDETDVIKSFNNNDDIIGETVNLYLVNGFVGAAVQTSEAANNYAVITSVKENTEAEDAWNPLELQILTAEGTKTTIAVSEDSDDNNSDDKITDDDYKVGQIIVYTGSDDDAVVTVKSAEEKNVGYSDSTKAFAGTVTSADCVLFATNADGAYKVYNIRDLDAIEKGTAQVVYSNNRVVAVSMTLGKTPAGATSSTVYGIVASYDGRVKVDDSSYRQYTVVSNDETYTLYMPTSATVAAGDLVSFEPTSDDTYANNDVDVITSGAIYVDEYSESDGTLTYFTVVEKDADGGFAGVDQNTLALDDDCAIVYVDADEGEGGSDFGINSFDSVNGYKNAAIVTETSGDEQVIVAIFVETSGECDILSSTLSKGMDADDVKDLSDGIYTPADKDFANSTTDVTGNVADNRIVKFTVGAEATTSVSLSVKGGDVDYTETLTVDYKANTAHFIYFHVYGGDNNPDLSEGGTFTVTVTDETNDVVLYSGMINVAPKGE